MKTLTRLAITIGFILIAIGCRCQEYSNHRKQFYKKTAYGLQHHSNYIPVLTSDSIYCVIENSHLWYMLKDKYSFEDYPQEIYRSLCDNGIVFVPFTYSGCEGEITPVYRNLTIPGIESNDISAIIETCFSANGCMKEQYNNTKYEGLIIELLFINEIAVKTDCETGFVIIDNDSDKK